MSHGMWEHGLMFMNVQESPPAIGSDSWSRFLSPDEPKSSLPPDFPRYAKTPQNHFKVMVRSQQESRASSVSSVEAPDEPLWVTLLGGFVGMLAFLVTWICLA